MISKKYKILSELFDSFDEWFLKISRKSENIDIIITSFRVMILLKSLILKRYFKNNLKEMKKYMEFYGKRNKTKKYVKLISKELKMKIMK